MSYTLGVFGVELAQVGPPSLPLLDQVEGLLDLVQHGEGEEVDLGEVGVGDAVLVPVHDEATVDGSRRGRGPSPGWESR